MTLFERLAEAIHAETPIALATRLDGPQAGAKMLVDAESAAGDLGTPGLNAAAAAEAQALLQLAQTSLRNFGEDGEPVGDEVRVFIQSFAPKPDMFVFGAIDFSRAMASIGKFMGYRVTVIDARPVFATKARIPDADEIVVAWPDEFLATAKVDSRTALIVLTHDVKFDVPLLLVALRSKAGYIGAMGSRRTHANRITALRDAGVSDGDLERVHAPIGLDIGARTPEETAISIAAEIVSKRAGRAGGSLRLSDLPVHGPPPEAAKAAV
jgi:xanthine dehydrogenase accessory factor